MVRPEILTKESMLADYAPEFVVDVWPGVKSVHGTHSFQSSAGRHCNCTSESVLSVGKFGILVIPYRVSLGWFYYTGFSCPCKFAFYTNPALKLLLFKRKLSCYTNYDGPSFRGGPLASAPKEENASERAVGVCAGAKRPPHVQSACFCSKSGKNWDGLPKVFFDRPEAAPLGRPVDFY